MDILDEVIELYDFLALNRVAVIASLMVSGEEHIARQFEARTNNIRNTRRDLIEWANET